MPAAPRRHTVSARRAFRVAAPIIVKSRPTGGTPGAAANPASPGTMPLPMVLILGGKLGREAIPDGRQFLCSCLGLQCQRGIGVPNLDIRPQTRSCTQ
jgi:hypothetical protein